MLWKDRDANAGGDEELVVLNLIGRAQGVQILLGLTAAGNGEFVAAHAPGQAVNARQAPQPARYRLEQFIAGRIRERAVDLLESIEIDKEHCQLFGHGVQSDVEELDET